MAIQNYNTQAERIAKQKGETLAHAVPWLCLSMSGDQKQMKKNMSKTVVYRRWLPKGGSTGSASSINNWDVDANAHLVADGVTPTAETMSAQDITVQLQQYACLYSYTDQTADLYEDNIPEQMKIQVGERMGLVREKIDYGTLKSCTNKFYAGGASRSAVDAAISLGLLRQVTRSIKGNRGKMINRVISASPNYNTAPVEPGYLVFVHTDAEADIRDLPDFTKCAEYGSGMTKVHDMEIGAVENFRFIVSPELDPILGAGASVGSTGLVSAGASNVDVYPFIVVAKDAWANVALRGMASFDIKHIPHNKEDKIDPLGQRGYVGAKFYSAAFIQNDGWMAVLECGVTDL